MKRWWPFPLLMVTFVALIWWSRLPLPARKAASTDITPAPMNARPIVHTRMNDRLPNEPRIQLKEENRLTVLKFRLLQTVQKYPPEGRSWESMNEQEFISSVEEWSNELAEHLVDQASSDELADLAYDLYPQVHSPYLRYVLFSWAVRFDMDRDPKKLLQWLAREPMLQQSGEAEHENHEDADVRVTRLLGNALLQQYGMNVLNNMKPAAIKEALVPVRSSVGGLRVEALSQQMR